LFDLLNIHLPSDCSLHHLTSVTRLVSHGGFLKKLGISFLFLLFAAHTRVVDESIIKIVVLIIEIISDFRIIFRWLLNFFLFIGLSKMSPVLLDWGQTILKLKTRNH
jgi:hypothetical protein